MSDKVDTTKLETDPRCISIQPNPETASLFYNQDRRLQQEFNKKFWTKINILTPKPSVSKNSMINSKTYSNSLMIKQSRS